MDVAKVTPQQLRQYLTYLLTEYVPRRITGNNDVKLSPKTVRNVWVTLSAFFHLWGREANRSYGDATGGGGGKDLINIRLVIPIC